jgi:hypothetical protein
MNRYRTGTRALQARAGGNRRAQAEVIKPPSAPSLQLAGARRRLEGDGLSQAGGMLESSDRRIPPGRSTMPFMVSRVRLPSTPTTFRRPGGSTAIPGSLGRALGRHSMGFLRPDAFRDPLGGLGDRTHRGIGSRRRAAFAVAAINPDGAATGGVAGIDIAPAVMKLRRRSTPWRAAPSTIKPVWACGGRSHRRRRGDTSGSRLPGRRPRCAGELPVLRERRNDAHFNKCGRGIGFTVADDGLVENPVAVQENGALYRTDSHSPSW